MRKLYITISLSLFFVLFGLSDLLAQVPVVTASQSRTINENSIVASNIGAVLTASNTPTSWAITVNSPNSSFAIDNAGQLTVANTMDLDFEVDPSLNITVTATNGSGTSAPVVVVIDLNDIAPVLVAGGPFDVDENATNGTSVGTVTLGAAGDQNSVTFSITAGNTNTAFAINSSSGVITVIDTDEIDFEGVASYILTVEATDGTADATDDYDVDINDVAPVLVAGGPFDVDENATNGTSVGTVTLGAAGDQNSVTFSITAGNTGTAFAINSSTGVITVANPLDYVVLNQYLLTVQATDGTTPDTEGYTIDVNDVTAPLFSAASVENGNRNALIVTFSEAVNVANVSDFSLNTNNPTPLLITAVEAGDGTDEITFTLDRNVNAIESISIDYDDANGYVDDLSGNLLASFAAEAVTNNVLNSAPVLDAGQTPVLTAIDEDNFTNAGNSVAQIVVDGSITDPEGAIEAIAVTAIDNTNGLWQYSVDNGSNWTNFSGTTGSSVNIASTARLLDGTLGGATTHRVRFVPNANYNGSATFTFRVWDKSTGTAGNTADATANGGTTAFSALSDVATVTINAVNDAPVLAGTAAFTAINEDNITSTGTLISSLITSFAGNYTDIEGGDPRGLAVTSVSNTNGTWQFTTDGTLWNTLNPGGDTDARLLASDGNNAIRFVPSADYNGAVSNTITVRAWDQASGADGSAANVSTNGGTTAFSSGTGTASITVNAVNDEPVFSTAPANQNVNSDAGAVSVPLFIDPSLHITFGPADETAQTVADFVMSEASDANNVVSTVDIANDGTLSYTVASQSNGTATINVQIQDNGGTANGGDNTSPIYTFDIVVTDNQDPTITARTPSDGATGVVARNTLQFTFNEAVARGTGSIRIYDNSNGTQVLSMPVSNTDSVTITTNTIVNVTFDDFLLKNGVVYYVLIDDGAFVDVNAGNTFGISSPTAWDFTMAAATTSGPQLLYTIPRNGQTGVSTTQPIKFVYDENVELTGTNNTQFRLNTETSLTGPEITGDVIVIDIDNNENADFGLNATIASSTNVVTINLAQTPAVITSEVTGTLPFTFAENTFYSVEQAASAWEDSQLNDAGAISKVYFRTVQDGTPPALAALNGGASPTQPFQPVDGATGVSVGTTMLYVTFNEAIAKGTGNISIYADLSPSDLLISSTAVTNGAFSVSGSQLSINLSTLGVTLSGGVTYYVQIANNAVKDAFGNSYAGISNTTTWNFTTADDVTAPTITTLSPVDNGTEVGLSPTMTITFNEPIKKIASAASRYINIYFASNDVLFAQVDANATTVSGNAASFTAGSAFPGFTDFYIRVDAGAFFDYSTVPNNFAGISTKTRWNFKTTATGDVTAPVASFVTATPVDGATGISNETSFSITFNEPIAAGTGTISLFNAAGNVLTDSWNVTTDVNISSSTATFTLNIDSLTYNNSYYLQWPLGTFEDLLGNQAAAVSNTTSWNFTVQTDTYAPVLAASPYLPLDNATGVALQPSIELEFKEPIQAGTGNLVIYLADGATVAYTIPAASLSYATPRKAIANLNSLGITLSGNTEYRIGLASGVLRDGNNNNFAGFAADGRWSFTTGGDVVAPTFVFSSSVPADGASSVGTSATLSVAFSEPVVPNTGFISVKNAGDNSTWTSISVASGIASSANTVYTYTLPLPLNSSTNYYVNIDTQAFRDTNGSPNFTAAVSNATDWNFSTSSAATVTPATLLVCNDGDYSSLGAISIAESANSDFSSGGTYIITLPLTFEFNPAATVTFTNGTHSDISTPVAGTLNSNSFTFSYTVNSTSGLDEIVIEGLEVKFTGGSDIAASLTRSGGTAIQAGNYSYHSQSHAALSGIYSDSPSVAYNTFTNYNGETLQDGFVYNFFEENSFTRSYSSVLGNVVTLSGAVNDTRWYTAADLSAFEASLDGATTATMGELGLDDSGDLMDGLQPDGQHTSTFYDYPNNPDPAGVFTWWVTNTDADGCESDPTKVVVGRFDVYGAYPNNTIDNDENSRLFFYYDNPAGHTITWSGPGLSSSANIGNPYTYYKYVTFNPVAAGLGSHTVGVQITNNTTGDSFSKSYNVTVVPTTSILPGGNDETCDYLTVAGTDLNRYENFFIEINDLSGAGYVMHKMELYSYNTGTEVPSNAFYAVVGGNPVSPDDIFQVANQAGDYYDPNNGAYSSIHGSITQWRIDKSLLDPGYYLLRRYVTFTGDLDPEDAISNASVSFVLGTEQIQVFSSPYTYVTNLSFFNCASDDPLDLEVSVGGTSYSSPSGQFYYQVHDGTSFGAEIPLGSAQLDFASLGEGRYNLIYVSADSEDPINDCKSRSAFNQEFYINPQPDVPTFAVSADILDYGGLVDVDGDTNADDYFFELCVGTTVPNLGLPASSVGYYIWSLDVNGNNILSTSNILSATTLFGGTNRPNALTKTIYVTEYNTSTTCRSEVRRMDIEIYAIPSAPVVDETGGDNIFNQGSNSYLIEYCDTDDVVSITLDESYLQTGLPVTKESYFQWFEDDGSGNPGALLVEGDVLTAADMGLNATGGNAVTTLKFHVIQYNERDLTPGFAGCPSAKSTIQVKVYSTPSDPVATVGNGFRTQYYAVENSTTLTSSGVGGISFLNTPTTTSAVFRWYADDDGSGTVPAATMITESPILTVADAELNGLDLSAPGDYYFWVSQATSKNFVSGFSGCESGAVRVAITVFDSPDVPALVNTNTEYTYCTTDDYASQVFEIASSTYLGSQGSQEYRWYRSDINGVKQNLNAVYVGVDPTAQELGITGLTSTQTRYYMATNVTDIIGANGADFAGGESAGVVIAFNFYLTPSAINIPVDDRTYYYCEDDVNSTNITELTATSSIDGVEFNWYLDGTLITTEADENAGVTSASTVNPITDLGIDPTVDGVYDVTVSQLRYNAAQPGFLGCESPITTTSTIRISIFAKPTTPTPTNLTPSNCEGETIPTLTVTGKLPGATVQWYDGNMDLVHTGDTYQPNSGVALAVGEYRYYVTQINNVVGAFTGCESVTPAEIVYNVYGNGFVPDLVDFNSVDNNGTAGDASDDIYEFVYCLNESVSIVSIDNPQASPVTYQWFKNTGLTEQAGIDGSTFDPSALVNTSVAGITSFYVRRYANGCDGPARRFDVIIQPQPTAPTIVESTIYYCFGADIQDITVGGDVGAVYNWYRDTDGDGDFLDNLLVVGGTNTATDTELELDGTLNPGIYEVYVTQNLNLGADALCESATRKITVQVLEVPVEPTLADITPICEGDDFPTLRITNRVVIQGVSANVTWYSDALLTTQVATTATYQPTIASTPGTYRYYVTQTTNNGINSSLFAGCESTADFVDIVVHPIPDAPEVNTELEGSDYVYEYCIGATVADMEILNPDADPSVEYRWYSNVNLSSGSFLGTGTTKFPTGASTTSAGEKLFYVTKTKYIDDNINFGGCTSSDATVIKILVNDHPVAPTVSGTTELTNYYCEDVLVATDEFSVESAYTAGEIDGYNWVFDIDNDGDDDVVTTAGNSTTSTVTADDLGLVGRVPGTYEILVTQDVDMDSGTPSVVCESNTLTIKVVILQIPAAPVVISFDPICAGEDFPTLSITNRAASEDDAAATVNWYRDEALTDLASSNPSFQPTVASDAGTYEYWVTQNTNEEIGSTTFAGCESPATKVEIVVHPIPAAPEVATELEGSEYVYEYCIGGDILTMAIEGADETKYVYRWYNNSSLASSALIGTGASVPPSGITSASEGAKLFYVTQTEFSSDSYEGCTSAFSTVKIQINGTPVAPTVAGTTEATNYYCAGDAIGDLTVQSANTGTYNWYYDGSLVSGVTGSTATAAELGLVDLEPGNYQVQVSQNVDTDAGTPEVICESSKLTINVRMLAVPDMLDINAVNPVCEGPSVSFPLLSVVASSRASGATIQWYEDRNATQLNATADLTWQTADLVSEDGVPTSYRYLATQRTNFDINGSGFAGCTSDADEIDVIVNPEPSAPAVVGTLVDAQYVNEYCVGNEIFDIEIDGEEAGETYKWYTSNTLSASSQIGTGVAIAPTGIANPAVTAADRTFYVTKTQYATDNFAGCTSPDTEVRVVVNALPTLNFTQNGVAANIAVCISTDDVELVAQDGVGIFSGDGVTDNGDGTGIFNPASALGLTDFESLTAAQTLDVTLSFTEDLVFTDGAGCSSTIVRTVTINRLPEVNFFSPGTGFDPEDGEFSICASETVIDLSPFGTSGGSFTADFGISSTATGARFNPLSARTQDGSGLYGESSDYGITYSFTDANGCTNDIIKVINVLPQPEMDFSIAGGCTGEEVDFEAEVLNEALLASGLQSFVWDFTNNGQSDDDYTSASGDDRAATNEYLITIPNATQQSFSIKLTGVSGDGCSTERVRTIDVGASPTPVFAWSGLTENQSTLFEIADPGINIQTVQNVRLDIYSEGDLVFSESRDRNPALNDAQQRAFLQGNVVTAFNGEGVYDAVLSITSINQCFGQLSRDLQILDVVVVTPEDPYVANFDAGPGGWYADTTYNESPRPLGFTKFRMDKRPNSWVNAAPQGVSMVNPNRVGWVTNPSGNYEFNEMSWVYSPAFDISALERPMVKFDVMFDFDLRKDGVVLQYSGDDGATWGTLGDFSAIDEESTGINWYTQADIVSDPGGQEDEIAGSERVGWAGNSPTSLVPVLEARHKLDEIPGDKRRVRFRFALAADNADDGANTEEGFAFDNFWIGERTKQVVLEKFVSTTSGSSRTADVAIDNMLRNPVTNNNEILDISYHTEFKEDARLTDPFNQVNKADPGARVLYYGVNRVPLSIISGDLSEDTFNGSVSETTPYTESTLSKASLFDPLAGITLEQLPSDDKVLSVSVTYSKPNVDLENVEHKLYVAVVEKAIYFDNSDGISDNDTLRNVVRKLLPDGSGFRIDGFANLGDAERSEVFTWEISGKMVEDPEQLAVVAFIQNNDSKIIYQSAKIDIVGKQADATGVDIPGELASSYNLYPNPASTEVKVRFDNTLNNDFDWQLVNQAGAVISSGIVKKGSDSIDLDTRRIPSGMYFVIVGNDNARFEPKKLVVIH